jgi:opacity protein-like surface antigen
MRIASESLASASLSPIGVTSRLIATCAIALAGLSEVSAADIPPAAKVAPPAIAASWAGFYLGVHGGYGWGRNDFADLQADFNYIGPINSGGGVYGAHAGYNWQFGRAVAGLEIDFSASDIRGSVSRSGIVPGQFTFNHTRTDRAKYLGTARGRLGWTATDNVLIFGTAGVAWERFETSFDERDVSNVNAFQNGTNSGRTPFDRLGWVAGAGAEARLAGSNWIGRLEYLHYDFGAVERASSRFGTLPNFPPFAERSGRQSYDIVRAALSYKFGTLAAAAPAPYAKAPVIATSMSSWAGFYLGVHGGYGWGANKYSDPWNFTPLASITGPGLKGAVYGGHAGYNWQFDRAVAGFELDFSGTGIKGTSPTGFAAADSAASSTNIAYLGSLRARLGWSATDNLLLYGTAGLGWERLDRDLLIVRAGQAGTQRFDSVAATNRFGWVAGVGVEAKLPGSNWIGRVEYLHYDFGTIQPSGLINTNIFVPSSAGNHHLDIVRAGLSYKFGDPTGMTAVPYAKAPAVAGAATHWAGYYLGAHGGYAWKNNDFTQVVNFVDFGQVGGITSRGWVAGGHTGYNWQYGRVVTGLEVDFSLSDIRGNSGSVVGGNGFPGFMETHSLGDRVKYLATARARLGWLPTENALLYATGGPAWERLERTGTTASAQAGLSMVESTTTPSDHFGGVIGAGAEWMPWGPNWIGRLEYLHYDFGKVQDTVTFTSTVPGDQSYSERRGRQTIEVLRAGISYKFGAEPPVVARY